MAKDEKLTEKLYTETLRALKLDGMWSDHFEVHSGRYQTLKKAKRANNNEHLLSIFLENTQKSRLGIV